MIHYCLLNRHYSTTKAVKPYGKTSLFKPYALWTSVGAGCCVRKQHLTPLTVYSR